MNLIDAEVVQSGSQVTLKMSDTVSITLPAEKSEKLKSYVGKTVVVGGRAVVRGLTFAVHVVCAIS